MKKVVSALIQKGDSILIQFHNKHQMLTIPIGGVEDGETIYEAIVREIKEELGVEKVKLWGHWEFKHEDIGVNEFMFSVDLLEEWHNAEPHKHKWMEFKKVGDLLKDETFKSNSLIKALEICKGK